MNATSVTKLQPGMMLTRDIINSDNRFLLAEGTILSSDDIRILKMWGVVEAHVTGESTSLKDADRESPSNIETIRPLVESRFRHTDLTNTVIAELFRLITERKAALHDGEAPPKDIIDTHSLPQSFTFRVFNTLKPKLNFEQLIQDDTKLSTLPDVLAKINETIAKPNSSAADIADVISKDANLSACVLRIANSAFYGFPSKIDTLSRAIALLGTQQVSSLCYAVNVIGMFKHIPSSLVDMKSFWKHSLACAITARIIAGYKNIRNTERLFVAGLLHDIGRLILFNHSQLYAVFTLIKAKQHNSMLYVTENETLGHSHARIGGYLLQKWNLPASLETVIIHHHSPMQAANVLEASIVHVADIIANAMEIGTSGERYIPPLDPEAWEEIGLSHNHLSLIINQVDQQIDETYNLFFSHHA